MKFSKDYFTLLFRSVFSQRARREFKQYLCSNSSKKLVMTLLVKDDEVLIERFVRFHFSMGIDVLIVMLHNCTDRTGEIINKLKQEGYPIEIIVKNTKEWNQKKFVHEMILLAKRKYKAYWIINSDSDEFYFSHDLNLKKTLLNLPKKVNCVTIPSVYSFPCDDLVSDFFMTPYWVTNPISSFEYIYI